MIGKWVIYGNRRVCNSIEKSGVKCFENVIVEVHCLWNYLNVCFISDDEQWVRISMHLNNKGNTVFSFFLVIFHCLLQHCVFGREISKYVLVLNIWLLKWKSFKIYFLVLKCKEVFRKKFVTVPGNKYPTLVVLLHVAVIPVFCYRWSAISTSYDLLYIGESLLAYGKRTWRSWRSTCRKCSG